MGQLAGQCPPRVAERATAGRDAGLRGTASSGRSSPPRGATQLLLTPCAPKAIGETCNTGTQTPQSRTPGATLHKSAPRPRPHNVVSAPCPPPPQRGRRRRRGSALSPDSSGLNKVLFSEKQKCLHRLHKGKAKSIQFFLPRPKDSAHVSLPAPGDATTENGFARGSFRGNGKSKETQAPRKHPRRVKAENAL